MLVLNPLLYPTTMQEAQELAEQVKTEQPELRAKVEELQGIVTRAYDQLHELCPYHEEAHTLQTPEQWKPVAVALLDAQAVAALTNLEAAYQSLYHLKEQ